MLLGNPGTTDDPAPTESGTWPASSQYDISRYTVQAWSGSAWQTVASVSGNTKHIVRLAFAPVTTDRIRVIPADDASNGQTANDNLVSLTEIEVRSPAGAGQIRTQRFDAWGRLEQAAGSVPTYGFTGREPDATGLIHYRARYYHPELGRFVSRDPLGLSAGINPYAYADGNPVLFNDPDGLMAALAWNSANQYYNDYQVGTRVQGALQFGAGLGMGALGTGVGVTTGWTGLGAVGGGALIALGSDQMSAGFQTLVSGKSTPSLLNQGLQAAGASPTQAAWGEAAITIGASGGVSMLSQSGRSFVQAAGVADDVFAAQGAGRLGNQATRQHVDQVATEMERRGWTIKHGGGRGPEEYLPGPGGARKGSSYPDITATKNGRTLRVNTVDTYADGVTPTAREATNAARIRAQTGEHLLLIPKP